MVIENFPSNNIKWLPHLSPSVINDAKAKALTADDEYSDEKKKEEIANLFNCFATFVVRSSVSGFDFDVREHKSSDLCLIFITIG